MTLSQTPVRLLHLEDNPRAAQLVEQRLNSEGMSCHIVHVKSRAQFESAVTKQQFDLVLCDYDIPSYDGFSAMKRARRSHPDVPVIFLSGAMGDDPTLTCLDRGAADYLLKYRLECLVPAMKRVLHISAEQRKQNITKTIVRKPAPIQGQGQALRAVAA